jgi:hypothetical protein
MSCARRPRLRFKREQTDNGGEEERDSKRPRYTRISKPISSKGKISSDTTMVNDIAALPSSSNAPQSNATTTTAVATSTASTIKNTITSKKNGDALPTKDELKKELYKLVDTDHFSRDEALQALHRIIEWHDIDDDDNFRDCFNNYAGLQIVLDFVEKFSNDTECVENATLVLLDLIYNYDHECGDSPNIIFNHGGIAILLQSTSNLIEGNLDGPKLKALKNIWGLFDIIFYSIDADWNNIDTSSKSFKNRFYSIVDSCLGILTKLQSRVDRTSFGIMSNAFSILGYASKISAKMKDCAVVIGEIRNKEIIPKMLEVFKMEDDSWSCRDGILLRSALRMLTDLNDNNLLTQASEFQSLLPLMVVAIKKFPPGIWLESSNIITVLKKATDTIENKLILEKAGVLGPLVSLLKKDSTNDRMKDIVRNLVAKICTR